MKTRFKGAIALICISLLTCTGCSMITQPARRVYSDYEDAAALKDRLVQDVKKSDEKGLRDDLLKICARTVAVRKNRLWLVNSRANVQTLAHESSILYADGGFYDCSIYYSTDGIAEAVNASCTDNGNETYINLTGDAESVSFLSGGKKEAESGRTAAEMLTDTLSDIAVGGNWNWFVKRLDLLEFSLNEGKDGTLFLELWPEDPEAWDRRTKEITSPKGMPGLFNGNTRIRLIMDSNMALRSISYQTQEAGGEETIKMIAVEEAREIQIQWLLDLFKSFDSLKENDPVAPVPEA